MSQAYYSPVMLRLCLLMKSAAITSITSVTALRTTAARFVPLVRYRLVLQPVAMGVRRVGMILNGCNVMPPQIVSASRLVLPRPRPVAIAAFKSFSAAQTGSGLQPMFVLAKVNV